MQALRERPPGRPPAVEARGTSVDGGERTLVTSILAAELDLENLLLRIPHVLGARVRLTSDGSVDRIHLLANRHARAERLTFEVERLLEEQRALKLDPGIVSVVSLEDGEPAPTPPARAAEPARIELRRLTFAPADELRVRASAELRLREIVFTGEACDADLSRARPVLAARAVLAALEFLREQGTAFYLEGIEFLAGFHAPVALAIVHALSERDKRALTGCALVTDSREEAAARATLAAINRFYSSLRAPSRP
jgi:hypothetical protein